MAEARGRSAAARVIGRGSPRGLAAQVYRTPDGLDDLVMASADGEGLSALCFLGSRDLPTCDGLRTEWRPLPAFRETRRWLNAYFCGRNPGFLPPLDLSALTPFRRRVAEEMLKIPFGATVSYGEIASALGSSARAVGGAVGANPVCIIIPCHRVIGADGSMTGYGGGMANKVALLRLEGAVA